MIGFGRVDSEVFVHFGFEGSKKIIILMRISLIMLFLCFSESNDVLENSPNVEEWFD